MNHMLEIIFFLENKNENINEDEEDIHSENEGENNSGSDNNSDNKNEDQNKNNGEKTNMFVQGVVQMNTCTTVEPQLFIMDSGASFSGVSKVSQLNNAQACHIPITPAFGSSMHAQTRGTINDPLIGHLGIPALHLPAMNQNLCSVFGFCTGGSTGVQQMGVFTVEGCRFYPLPAYESYIIIFC